MNFGNYDIEQMIEECECVVISSSRLSGRLYLINQLKEKENNNEYRVPIKTEGSIPRC